MPKRRRRETDDVVALAADDGVSPSWTHGQPPLKKKPPHAIDKYIHKQKVSVRPADFSAEVRTKAGSEAVLERVDVAIRRLLNVLERELVAGIRTLEMKICDAGPAPMRVEPHVLGLAGLELLKYRNRVAAFTLPSTGTHLWYAPIRLTQADYGPRLTELVETYLKTTNPLFTAGLGEPLEISVFKILRGLKRSDRRFMYFGSFDLTSRNAFGRFRKIEPTTNYNEAALDGPPDFAIFDPVSGETAIIECKNHREWVYLSSEPIKTLVAKALAAQMTPIMIARRMSAITKFLRRCGLRCSFPRAPRTRSCAGSTVR